MKNAKETPTTQGQIKILQYIDDLIRKKSFLRVVKRLRREIKKDERAIGLYEAWPKEQQAKHDYINSEAASIIGAYEILRKRCAKLLRDKQFVYKEKIASEYGIDQDLLNITLSKIENDEKRLQFYLDYYGDIDMCRLFPIEDDELNPESKGEEIIYLAPHRQLTYLAYPVAIGIHQKASKRDVLDYIEKRWRFVESCLRPFAEQKVLQIRKRKHKQEILDFIWANRGLSSRQIKRLLDERYPNNGLAYFEINKMVSIEKGRRLE